MLAFKQSSLISRMVMGKKGTKYDLMEEFDWLWTKEERQQAKMDRIERELMSRVDTDNHAPKTTAEQSDMLQGAKAKLEKMMQEARRKAHT